MQTPQIRSECAFNEHLDAIGGDLAEPGRFPMPKVGAHRDLGGGTGSMVQADQIKNRQPTPLLDVVQRLGSERNRYLGRRSVAILSNLDRLTKPQPLYVKPRRHDALKPSRFPSPIPP